MNEDMKVLGVVLSHWQSVPDVSETHLDGCLVTHLSYAGYPSHQTSSIDTAQMLQCSLILSRIDYWNAVLHGAPTGTIQKLQWVRNNAAQIVLQALRWSHHPMSSRYCTSCIGCRSSSGSHTSWQFWRTKLEHVHSSLPARPNHGTCLQPNFMFIFHHAAGPTVH